MNTSACERIGAPGTGLCLSSAGERQQALLSSCTLGRSQSLLLFPQLTAGPLRDIRQATTPIHVCLGDPHLNCLVAPVCSVRADTLLSGFDTIFSDTWCRTREELLCSHTSSLGLVDVPQLRWGLSHVFQIRLHRPRTGDG